MVIDDREFYAIAFEIEKNCFYSSEKNDAFAELCYMKKANTAGILAHKIDFNHNCGSIEKVLFC